MPPWPPTLLVAEPGFETSLPNIRVPHTGLGAQLKFSWSTTLLGLFLMIMKIFIAKAPRKMPDTYKHL